MNKNTINQSFTKENTSNNLSFCNEIDDNFGNFAHSSIKCLSLEIRNIEVIRYITPLREGGSLPAIVEADDAQQYVLKFKGAGQGQKALISEFIGGELARHLGFLVPEIVFANLDKGFGMTEGDEEIQDLLKASEGLNLGMKYLSGAITFDDNVVKVNNLVASMIVWLDTLITNVDRTAKNTNMLMWKNDLWLIDHGAALYFHHNWDGWEAHAEKSFALIKDHVLFHRATKLDEANELMKSEINEAVITSIVESLPLQWLNFRSDYSTPEEVRSVYQQYLLKRLSISDKFTKEIKDGQ